MYRGARGGGQCSLQIATETRFRIDEGAGDHRQSVGYMYRWLLDHVVGRTEVANVWRSLEMADAGKDVG